MSGSNTGADDQAFVRLLEPIKDSLYSYARRMLWNREQAADVVQDAVLTAWRSFDKFERGSNFKAWVFRILVNTIFNVNRRTQRRKEYEFADRWSDAFLSAEREDAWSVLLHRPDMLLQMLDERLVAALDRLSEDERQCFLLHQLEGFTYREIAAMLDMPLGTVMSHMHRARKQLRERLASLAVEQGLIKETAP